mgnify:CR=1 FL=1
MGLGGIFSIDSKFSQVMSRLFDLMILNLIFIVMCIPIVTIGANVTAMYYVTIKMVRNEDSYTFKSYWKSFKENFKQSTIIWLILLVAGLFLISDIYLVNNVMTGAITNIKYIFFFLLMVYFFVMLYVFPSQSRFYNTIKHTLKNSLLFSIRHLPYTILMLAVIVVPFFVCLYSSGTIFSFYIMFLFLFGFSATAYVNSIFLNKIFKKYMPPEEEEPSDSDLIAHLDALDAQEQETLENKENE